MLKSLTSTLVVHLEDWNLSVALNKLYSLDHILLPSIFLIFDDEPLPTINKPKHPRKKGEYKEQNGRTHIQEDK
jgi:hypothetical protein